MIKFDAKSTYLTDFQGTANNIFRRHGLDKIKGFERISMSIFVGGFSPFYFLFLLFFYFFFVQLFMFSTIFLWWLIFSQLIPKFHTKIPINEEYFIKFQSWSALRMFLELLSHGGIICYIVVLWLFFFFFFDMILKILIFLIFIWSFLSILQLMIFFN